jgi:SNF2 family DNA or RNA helicase
MLNIAYEPEARRAILTWKSSDRDSEWVRLLRRVFLDHSDDVSQPSADAISLPWWTFLSARSQLKEVLSGYKVSLSADAEASRLLSQSATNEVTYDKAKSATAVPPAEITSKLATRGFTRSLTTQQLRNIGKLAGLMGGATFSVPGAGKTTEALALYFLRSEPIDRLLVVAPKNAFGAWDEQLGICAPGSGAFVRLRGGWERIEDLLVGDPRFMLITYQQLPRVRELIAQHLAAHRAFVFLDESHRIKSGVQRITAETVLSISHLPAGKLVMSGTPMPQSEADLIPQFSFLYPEVQASEATVADLFKPVYVRTTKRELDLPGVERRLIEFNLLPVQAKLYNLMRSEVARQAEHAMNTRNKMSFRKLGRSIIRLLQVVSNPALLAKEVGFAHEGLLSELLDEGRAPKIEYACKRARQLAREGRKSLIWTSFVSNVELIAQRLADLGAVYIHGGVDAGSEDDEESREGKIKAFHDDPTVRVMVANPAAASEGISLHTVCQNAIYVDRTFNAAHYLQSEDRIHRLGLRKDQKPTIEIVECRGTIDEIVRTRLGAKVDRMSAVLDDPSLNVDPIPFDVSDEVEDYGAGFSEDDLGAIVDGLKRGEGE